ncbi:MAG TPA: TlpA disulfide reductase family protein [Actinomycetota bacterium]|nr:TlpA disulfide reductase family protein [Actinomycetota bacterium]
MIDRAARSLATLGVTLLFAVAATGCAGDNPTIGTGAQRVALPSSATALPTFTVAQFDELKTDLHGKPLVVNIWASWCGPCTAEAPHLTRAARDFQGRVQFLGVDIQDQRPAAVSFIRRFGWTYPSVFDPPGAIRDDLGLIGQPHTLVFDSTGRQAYVSSGPVTEQELRTQLIKLTGSPAMAMQLVATASPTPSAPSAPSNGTTSLGPLLAMAAVALVIGSLSLLYVLRRLRRGVDSRHSGDPFGPA